MHSDDALLFASDDDDAVVIRPDAYDMASSPLPLLEIGGTADIS